MTVMNDKPRTLEVWVWAQRSVGAVSMGTSPDNCHKPVSGQSELWVWALGCTNMTSSGLQFEMAY